MPRSAIRASINPAKCAISKPQGPHRRIAPPAAARSARRAQWRGLKASRPSFVSLQTSQLGRTGFLRHGCAHPALIQALTVRALTRCPSRSNIGSLPPGWRSPSSNHRRCGSVGLCTACSLVVHLHFYAWSVAEAGRADQRDLVVMLIGGATAGGLYHPVWPGAAAGRSATACRRARAGRSARRP